MGNAPPPPPSGAPAPGPPPPTPAIVEHPPLLLISDWLTDTTRTLVKGFGDFFAVLTVLAIISTALSAPLLWISSADAVLTRDDDNLFNGIEGMTGTHGLMVAGGLLISAVGQVLLFTAATNHIDRLRSGDSPRWQETLGALVARGPRVVGVVAQVVFVAFVILLISGVLGGIGLGGIAIAIAFALIVLLWVRAAVASTHAALGGAGGSLRHSLAWTKGLTLPLLGRHIVLVTICVGLLLIGSIVSAPFQSLSGAAASTEGDLVLRDVIGSSLSAFVAVQFINALVSGFIAALWAAAMLSLYRGEAAER